jgi:hypothetical protein
MARGPGKALSAVRRKGLFFSPTKRMFRMVCYRYGEGAEEVERMDYLELIARVTSHIPDKGQVTIRYFGLYANAHRGKVRKSEELVDRAGRFG